MNSLKMKTVTSGGQVLLSLSCFLDVSLKYKFKGPQKVNRF